MYKNISFKGYVVYLFIYLYIYLFIYYNLMENN